MTEDPKPRPARGPSTRAVHAGAPPREPGRPVVSPLVASATFHAAPDEPGEALYGRYSNAESYRLLGERLAALEGAEAALVTASGMAAITLALLAFAGAGDEIVAADTLYGGTHTLLTKDLPRLGIQTRFVATGGRWRDAVRQETRALYLEVPVNPTLRVQDPRPLANLARERGIPLIVDATFATPVNLRPLEHGADVVVHSATKYLGGHSDLVAGVITGPRSVIDQARQRLKSFGQNLDPHGVWLLERGVKTLALRVERQNRNALELARWLEQHPAVAAVHHPGLASHPDHAVAAELFDGFGGMLSFVLHGGDEAALETLRRLELIAVAPSLGGVESLVSLPRYTSHVAWTDQQRRAVGIVPGFVRLSVGIEDVEDLRADLEAALPG